MKHIEVLPREGESRQSFMLRVAAAYIRNNPDDTLIYDGTDCDGYCIADDCEAAADFANP